MIEPVIVIVAYRPKPGRESETLDLVRSRVPTLRKEGLVTDRTPIIMRAGDGTIIEVSEWKSQEAIAAAHKNPNVLVMWNRFFEVCDCIPLNTLSESAEMAIVSRSTRYLNPPKCLPVSNRFPTDYSLYTTTFSSSPFQPGKVWVEHNITRCLWSDALLRARLRHTYPAL